MKANELLATLKKQLENGEIHPEEPVFLLRANDLFSAATLRYWAKLRRKLLGESCLVAAEAERQAIHMNRWKR